MVAIKLYSEVTSFVIYSKLFPKNQSGLVGNIIGHRVSKMKFVIEAKSYSLITLQIIVSIAGGARKEIMHLEQSIL